MPTFKTQHNQKHFKKYAIMWSIKFDNSIFQYWSVYSRYATLKDVLCAWSNHFKKENGKRKKGENYVIFYKIEHLYYD